MRLKQIRKLESKVMTLDVEVENTHTYQLANGWITHNTSSLILCSASGVHPHHSRRYFRRVQCNKLDSVYRYFKKYNSHMCEESVWSNNKTDDVITFPVTISDSATIKEDLTAIEHLKIIKKVQENWVLAGTSSVNKKPINHNVSCTVAVKKEEWESVINYVFDNRQYFGAIALLSYSGDKDYKQSPLEDVKTEEDIKKFNFLIENYKIVDYKLLTEENDNTNLVGEIACGGGACDLSLFKKPRKDN